MAAPAILILLFVASLFFVGLVLFIRALRGRVIDDHPLCRACHFDLVALPSTSTRCSECGADLLPPTPSSAVTAAAPGLAAFGAALMLPAVIVGSLLIYAAANDIDWIQHAPAFWLARQAKDPTPSTRDPALDELLRRFQGGELSDSRLASLITTGLAIQADPAAPWAPGWGNLIEAARSTNKLPDDQWREYLIHAPGYHIEVRPDVRRGDPLPVNLHHGSARAAARSIVSTRTKLQILPDSDPISPTSTADYGYSIDTLDTGLSGSTGYMYSPDHSLLAKSPDGQKSFHAKLTVELFTGQPSFTGGHPDATTTLDLRAPWTLLPKDAPTVKPIDNPAVRKEVESAIQVEEVALRYSKTYPQCRFKVGKLPVPIAYHVLLRAGDHEYPAGDLYVPANQTSTWGTGAEAKGFPATTTRADVILRPDPSVAARTINMHEYWTGEIIIKDVPILRSGVATQPAR